MNAINPFSVTKLIHGFRKKLVDAHAVHVIMGS